MRHKFRHLKWWFVDWWLAFYLVFAGAFRDWSPFTGFFMTTGSHLGSTPGLHLISLPQWFFFYLYQSLTPCCFISLPYSLHHIFIPLILTLGLPLWFKSSFAFVCPLKFVWCELGFDLGWFEMISYENLGIVHCQLKAIRTKVMQTCVKYKCN